MPITQIQKAQAERHQWAAAQANAPQVRLVAGPGTGKTSTIEKRVSWLLNQGVQPENLYVISFTRASCAELQQRITRFCSGQPTATSAVRVRVSTMHSLALRILRRANLLNAYPTSPILLDDWEQKNIYGAVLGHARERSELPTTRGGRPLIHRRSAKLKSPQLRYRGSMHFTLPGPTCTVASSPAR